MKTHQTACWPAEYSGVRLTEAKARVAIFKDNSEKDYMEIFV